MFEIYIEVHQRCFDTWLGPEMCVMDGCVVKQAW